MPATLKDIALRANTSVSTVSRILNNKAKRFRISKDTEDLVLKIADELSYRPNQLARGLRTKRSHTIGLLIPDISNPFFAYLTRVIQRITHELGYRLFVCDTDEELDLEVEHVRLLASTGVDGMIIMPVGQQYGHLEFLNKKNIPFVLIDRYFHELNVSSVTVDSYKGAYAAVEHLINFGHDRIAIIQGLPHTYTSTKRLQGYKDALAHHSVPLDEALIVGNDFRKENGYIATKFLLDMQCPPTGIFTTSDLITLGAFQAIFEEKLEIPEDVSLVAFDDIDFAPYLVAPLTTVAQPREMMGEIAVKLLMEQIDGETKVDARRIVLEPQLMVRGSVSKLNKETAAVLAK